MAYRQRGLDSAQEQDQSKIIRDTRTITMRFADTLKSQIGLSVTMIAGATAAFLMGYLSEIILIFCVWCFIYGYFQKRGLPFRMPLASHMIDYNDIASGSVKGRIARGIYFFGNERKDHDELWFSNEDMRTHVLIFGSTGSGKTQALTSLWIYLCGW